MQKIIALAALLLTAGCSPSEKKTVEADNELDAARLFVRAALDGKFDEASLYMLQDSLNNNYLEIAARSYEKMTPAERDNYKAATIVIHQAASSNDSTAVVIFSNSFKNDHDTLRIVRNQEQWKVDLKYLFEHDQPIDSLIRQKLP